MKNSVKLYLFLLGVFISLSITTPGYATKLVTKLTNHTNLHDYGYFIQLPGSYTPAENIFIMQRGAKTTVDSFTGSATSEQLIVDANTPSSSATIHNVGWYNGHSVSVHVSLHKNLDNFAGGTLSLAKESFLNLTIDGDVEVSYEFFDETNTPLAITTTVNCNQLNKQFYFGVTNVSFKTLHAYEPTNIFSRTWRDDKGIYWVTYHNEVDGAATGDTKQQLEIVTQPTKSIRFIYHNNTRNPVNVPYHPQFIAKPEFGAAYANSLILDKPESVLTLSSQQIIPKVPDNQKPNKLALYFDLTNILQSQQYHFENIRIDNFDGEDVTSLFTSQLQGNTLVVTANNPTDSRLCETTLSYHVNFKWQRYKHPVSDRFIENNKLSLFYAIRTEIQNSERAFDTTTSAHLAINYQGKVHVTFVDENNHSLQNTLVKSGILTQTFDVSKLYPEIPNYIPIKNTVTEDSGIYTLDTPTITHRYQRSMILSLKNPGDTLLVSRFNNQSLLHIWFKHESGKNIKLMAKLQNKKIVIKQYTAAQSDVQDNVYFDVPKNWLNKKVSFYLEDDLENISNIEQRTLIKEEKPTLIVPDNLSFGNQEVPPTDRFIKLSNNPLLHIKDDSQLDKGTWRIKVKLKKEMTSKDGQLLKHALYLNDEKTQNKKVMNNEEQLVASGNGNKIINLTKLLELKLSPSNSSGSYQGEIIWSLEDAPL